MRRLRPACTAGRRASQWALTSSFFLFPFSFLADQAQAPVFRSGVDMVAVDVQVIDRDGRPVTDLTPSDFVVAIDGRARPVTSATLLDYRTTLTPAAAKSAPASAPSTAVTPATPPRRLFLLVIDETSFGVDGSLAVMKSARRFIDTLRPGDLVGLKAIPVGGQELPFTSDHAAVRRALDLVVGRREGTIGGRYFMTPSEVIDIFVLDRQVLDRVVQRECLSIRATGSACERDLIAQARTAAAFYEATAAQSLGALRGLFESLQPIDGRKTVVLVSGGLVQSDRSSGRPDTSSMMQHAGEWAAAANAALYVLHFDTSFLDAFSAARGVPPAVDSQMRDRAVLGLGLERVVDKAGGGLIRIEAGTADYAFDRVIRESSAFYLLGVTPDDGDRDGKSHFLRVDVNRRGLTVRSRRQVVIPARRW